MSSFLWNYLMEFNDILESMDYSFFFFFFPMPLSFSSCFRNLKFVWSSGWVSPTLLFSFIFLSVLQFGCSLLSSLILFSGIYSLFLNPSHEITTKLWRRLLVFFIVEAESSCGIQFNDCWQIVYTLVQQRTRYNLYSVVSEISFTSTFSHFIYFINNPYFRNHKLIMQYINHELPDVKAGFRKKQRNQRSNCQHLLDHRKIKRFPEKHLFLPYDYAKAFDCVDHNKLWKILKEKGIPDHLTCLLRNLYAGQEATVRTGHGTTDWF